MYDYLKKIMDNYPDVIESYTFPMLIGIFTFALPLLLSVASRIDDKYNSSLLIKVFKKDWICKCFIWTLIPSIIMSIVWILSVPRCIDFGKEFNYWIDNSASIILIFFLMALLFFTICVIRLIYIYYVPEKLLVRLQKQYDNSNEKEKQIYFEAISKLLFYSIKQEGEPLSRALQQFYINEFSKYREDKKGKVVEYPTYYYNVLFDANEILCNRKKKSISLYNNSFYGLFIDEWQNTIISEATYSFLWKCLCQTVLYGIDDYILAYWKKAHQYFGFRLEPVGPQYDSECRVINQEEIEKRNEERERFLEFHYALGGVLMKEEKYALLQQLMMWTNCLPPKYYLVPNTMDEVVRQFMFVYGKNVWDYMKYPFPDVTLLGVYAEDVVKLWIKKYIAILFLRQYTLREYFINVKTLGMPDIPQSLSEKKRWKVGLKELKLFVNEFLADDKMLKSLGFEHLNSYFESNNSIFPDILIDNFLKSIEESIEQTKTNQEIDVNKRQEFDVETKRIICDFLSNYKTLRKTNSTENNNHKVLYCIGEPQLIDKMAFASEQDTCYPNANTILAHTIVSQLERCMLFAISQYKPKIFNLVKEDLLDAVDRLGLDCNNYSILSFGLNLHEKYDLFIKEGVKYYYKEIPYIPLDFCYHKSLFVVKNDDIPYFIMKTIDKETIRKYDLNEIDTLNHLYTSIIDLNKNIEIHKELKNQTDLDQKVLAIVGINAEIYYNVNAECVQLQVFSQFENMGNPNTLEDIQQICKAK